MTSELSFRAQLVIREQRELYDFWRARARAGEFPARGDIDPRSMSAALVPLVSIVEVGRDTLDLTYRLAGSGLHDIFGSELRGRAVFSLDLGERRAYWQAVYRSVIEARQPMQGAVKGPVAHRGHLVLFWLRLPLAEDGTVVDRVLCYDKALPVSIAFERPGYMLGEAG